MEGKSVIEKVKSIFAGLASLTVLLYAVGYITEYSHSRMLGISLVTPIKEYYLISGGTFIISTLYAIYSVILNIFLHFVWFLAIIVFFLWYGANSKKHNTTRSTIPGSKWVPMVYHSLVFILTLSFLLVAIPVFTSTFGFTDLLLPNSEPTFHYNHFTHLTSELWTWILNENPVNKQKLTVFYVWSIFSTVISAVMLYSMMRQWLRWKADKSGRNSLTNTLQSTSRWKSLRTKFHQVFLRPFLKYFFGLLIILMMFIVVIQLVTIPVNYGILIKSNHYPEVKVETMKAGIEFIENRDPQKEYKLWLIRENEDEVLLYAAFFEKNSEYTVYELFTLKKNLIKKIRVLANTFVFTVK